MRWAKVAFFLGAGAAGALVGAFAHDPLNEPGYFLLGLLRRAPRIGRYAVADPGRLFVSNLLMYGLAGSLGGFGFVYARRSRFWRTVLGIVSGFFTAVLWVTTFQSLAGFLLAPIVGIIVMRTFSPRISREMDHQTG